VLVFREDVEAQRAWPGVDEVDHLLDAVHFQHRQNRAEDLLLQHRRIRRHVHQYGGRDELIRPVVPAAVVDGPAREQRRQPVEVARVDDPAVVWTLLSSLPGNLR